MSDTNTVIAIDDHPLFRKGVADLITMVPELTMIGEAADAEEGLALIKQAKPDMVLLDLNMRGMDGIEVLKLIKQEYPKIRVIMLTVSDQESDVSAALRAGADGYLLKDMEPEDTVDCLKKAVQGKMVVSDRLMEQVLKALRHGPQAGNKTDNSLTDREKEILSLLTEGLSNKLIARRLKIAEGTVKVHIKHLLKKLKVTSRVEAVVWAMNEMK